MSAYDDLRAAVEALADRADEHIALDPVDDHGRGWRQAHRKFRNDLRALLATPAPETARCGIGGPREAMSDCVREQGHFGWHGDTKGGSWPHGNAPRYTPAPDLPTTVRCDTCGDTGRVEWMIEGDPNVYNPPDDDGKIACPDCATPTTVQADRWEPHELIGSACSCGNWRAEMLGVSIRRGFDQHLRDVQHGTTTAWLT